jgi:hypothetical protein
MWRLDRKDPETIENIQQGEIVVIAARWILILVGWVLTLWQPETVDSYELRLAIVLLMLYSSMNFFITVQWVNHSRNLAGTVQITSVIDLTLITVLVAVFGTDNLFVFYLPALLALAVTLPTRTTAFLTACSMLAYGLIAVVRAGDIIDTAEAQSIFVREILMVAVAFCGSLYREIEADRRQGKGRIFILFKELGPNRPETTIDPMPPREVNEATF